MPVGVNPPVLFQKLLLLAGLLALAPAARAQSPAVVLDSLRHRLAALPADTNRVLVLDELCWQLSGSDLPQATAYGRQGLALAGRLRYRRGQLKCLIDLGNCASYAPDFVAGTRYFLEAQRLARQAPARPEILGFAYNGLANLHISQHEYAEAQRNLELALALPRQTPANRALLGGSLGTVLRLRLQFAAAHRRLRQTLGLYDSLQNPLGRAHCLGQLAQLSADQHRWPAARRYARQALTVSRAIGNDYYLGTNLAVLGLAALAAGQVAAAEAATRQSLTYARHTGNRETVADDYETLTRIAARRQDFAQAYQWQSQRQALRDSLVNESKNAEIAALRVRFGADQQAAHIRELTQRNQVQQLRASQQRSRLLALLLGTVALALAGGGGLLYVVQRRRLAQLRHETALRSRIAADLHDDVGTLLTRVTMQAELLREAQPDPALDRLLTNARSAASTMRDVVWSIDAHADTVGALADRMRDYLNQLGPACAGALHLPADLPAARPLPPELRQHLYLVFKEAVTNVVRHARCATHLRVALRPEPGHLVLEVEDDGPLTPAAPVGRSGLGLRSMARRAAALGGTFEASPLPEKGFRVRLVVPF